MKPYTRRVAGLGALEAKLLSDLLQGGDRGMSPTELAIVADAPRPSVYAMLGRMRGLKWVSRTPDPTPEASQRVLYAVTAKGRKARERFAREVGLFTERGNA